MWQALRSELHPKGLEVVTVCLDAAGIDAARPFVEKAAPQHPSLLDIAHRVDELFGVVNIPNSVWIDEDGMIVRPAEPAFVQISDLRSRPASATEVPGRVGRLLKAASRIKADPAGYRASLLDWVELGAASSYALSPEQVVAASLPRSNDEAAAAAHFELGQHLFAAGDNRGAERHWREAHRLHPANWTYKRQAWSLVDASDTPLGRFWQGPIEGREEEWPYDGDWVSDIEAIGPANYYPTAR